MLEVALIADVTTVLEFTPAVIGAVTRITLGIKAALRGGSEVVVVACPWWATPVLEDPLCVAGTQWSPMQMVVEAGGLL